MTLEKCYKKMLIENPFYGIFLMGLAKTTDTTIETACVRKKGVFCELAINPDYWESLSDIEQYNLLLHEVLHIVFHHMFMWDYYEDKKLLNIATDCEVNSYIQNFPKDGIHPSLWGLQEKQGTKYYYESIKDKDDLANAPKSMDDHSTWKEEFGECSEVEKELVKNQINTQLKETAHQIIKSRGTIPAELKVTIDNLMKPKERIFDWKGYFRRLLGSIYDDAIKKTRRKESIRFPDSSGIKHLKKVSILVALDTSGSVSNKEIEEFFSEIYHIYRAGAYVKVIEFDTKITAEYEYKGKWDGVVHGRGGTDFCPALEYYTKYRRDFSSLIYFTDGGAYIPTTVLKSIVWVITSSGIVQDYPGKTIYIPKNKNNND